MKNILTHRLTWVKIVESVLLILLGILISVLGGVYNAELPNALTICLSIFLLADGLITLLSFWLEAKKNFTISAIIGSIFITTGVMLSMAAASGGANLARLIATFISVLIITFGGIFLIKGIIQTIYKGPIGWIIIHYLIAAVAIALGVCSIIYTSEALAIVLIVLGTAIAVLGAVDLIFAILAYRKYKKEHPTKKQPKEEKPKKVKVDVELEDDKVVLKDKKNNKKKAIKEKKPKQLENKTKQIELKEHKKEDKKDNSKKDDEPIVAEVIDPEE